MRTSVTDKNILTAAVNTRGSVKSQARLLENIGLVVALVVCDLLMIGTAMRFAYFIRFDLSLPIFDPGAFTSVPYYSSLVLRLIPIWLIMFALRGLYNRSHLLGGTQEYDLLFNANTLAMFSIIAVGFFDNGLIFARGWILIAWISSFLFTAAGRFILRRLVYMLRAKGLFLSNAIIVGYNEEADLMAEQLKTSKYSGLRVLGFVDNSMPDSKVVHASLQCMAPFSQLAEVVEKNGVDEIILTTSALSQQQILQIFETYGVSDKVRLRMSSGLYEIITTGLQVKETAWVPLVEVNRVRLTGSDRTLKAILDYGLAIPGVILISPILLLIAILIKLDSPGPVIHRRRVMGVNGKTFDAFKFRTMHVNGDEILARHPEKQAELAKNHKLKDDPRITRVGKFLRKYSLDELPQCFNVLRNEMSIVGPRMIAPNEVAEYTKWGINLLTVKPGITGKWQVSGRSDVTYAERVRMDMYYIRNWNIWLDIQLLIQTIPAVLSKRGAY